MTDRYQSVMPFATERQPAQGSEPAAGRSSVASSIELETTQTIFRQITHALTVLSSAAELTHNPERQPAQSIRIWLQPSARQAEEGLRRLRERHLPQSQALTELIQSLTVLVLAADMIAQGQLSSTAEPESYALMRRNAERAMGCIRELRLTSE